MDLDNQIIEVVPHDPEWQWEYLKEAEAICKMLGDEVINIYHIGSTAIPDIYAKPVIDILVEVNAIAAVDNYNESMSKAGYIVKGESGIAGRRYFVKGQQTRTHHVHIFQTGNTEIERHLNFRDYMIEHPEEARKYEELKKVLAEKFRFDRAGYVEGKTDYIKEVDKRAEEWAKTR